MALDIATQCGVAIGHSSGRPLPRSFSVTLKHRGQPPEVAASGMFTFLRDFAHNKPDLVFIEQFMNPAASKSAAATVLQLMAFGVAAAVCASWGARIETAAPATIRKHFCGRANAGDKASTKRMVLDRAKILGYIPLDCEDDNRADALAAWDYACAKFARSIPSDIALFGASP